MITSSSTYASLSPQLVREKKKAKLKSRPWTYLIIFLQYFPMRLSMHKKQGLFNKVMPMTLGQPTEPNISNK